MTFTPALLVALAAIAAVTVLAVVGSLTGTDAAGIIGSIVAGFGLGNAHANGQDGS